MKTYKWDKIIIKEFCKSRLFWEMNVLYMTFIIKAWQSHHLVQCENKLNIHWTFIFYIDPDCSSYWDKFNEIIFIK